MFWRNVTLLVGPLFAVACVNRDTDWVGRQLPCALETPSSSPADAVVVVRAPVGNTWLTICSGVAIAPTLVATQLKCVLGLSEPAKTEAPADDPVLPPLPPEFLDNRSGSIDYDAHCRPDAGWTTAEDGDFSGRLGAPLDPSVVSVTPTWVAPEVPGIPATRIFVMSTSSLCGDDLALVALGEQLEIPAVAIRFAETSAAAQELVLSGFCNHTTTNLLEVREFQSSIEEVTAAAATSQAPARSLVARGTVAAYSAGGAAIAPETNALVGLIMSGTLFSDCEPQDPEGTTLVMALAPYRRMLLYAAEEVSETLYAEMQPEIGVRPCPKP